nr:MAG TPA: hypothetical protein [Crassvirales sp.]
MQLHIVQHIHSLMMYRSQVYNLTRYRHYLQILFYN